jgi:hypothetical protein
MGERSWCSLPSTAQMLNGCKISLINAVFMATSEIFHNELIFYLSLLCLLFRNDSM